MIIELTNCGLEILNKIKVTGFVLIELRSSDEVKTN